MSIILDALRRGRGEQQAGPSSNAAQTDAVLQTLGYGRLNPASPLNRLKRMLVYVALAVVCGVVLWAAAIWLTRAYVSSVSPAASPSDETLTGAPAQMMSPGLHAPSGTASDDHFARAMMYQRLGDFENALVSYRQVLQRDDLNVEAHNNLGVLYRDKGLFEDAIRHFHRAIAINPGYARARNNLGVVYLSQRKLDMSATHFHAALAIDAKNVEAHYNLALLEDESGNRAQALTHYRAFLQHGAASHPTLVADVRKRLDALAAK